jgi:predicted enzyme related to lactoylglutathione lyase
MPPVPAAVVFVADVARVAAFYAQVFGMARIEGDAGYAVLEGAGFQLTVHALQGEPMPLGGVREDTYVKVCLPVESIEGARARAARAGGEIWPADREWASPSRGFRACDGRDPEGNVFQVREAM